MPGCQSSFSFSERPPGLVGAAITSNPWVRIIGGLVIIAFGLQLIGLLKISALYKDTRFFLE
jgi:cytochrome c biogenesis protein CcdA